MKVAYIIIGAIVVAGLAGAGGFFGGMTYAQSQAQNTVSDFARQRASQAQQGNAQGAANGAADNPCGFGGQVFQFPQGGQGGATQGNTQTNGQNNAQANGQNRRQGGQLGGAGFAELGNCVARGQIKSVNGNTVEVSTADSVVTIQVNDATVISKTERGTISDLQVGDRVTVFSKDTGTNPAASAIQLQRNLPPPNQ
jgi:hypothetical protein